MRFNDYQTATDQFAVYPLDRSVEYLALGLTSESGEVASKVKKILRDKNGVVSDADAYEIALELSDVCWYVAQFAKRLGYKAEELLDLNIQKLNSRKERGVIQGSGDHR